MPKKQKIQVQSQNSMFRHTVQGYVYNLLVVTNLFESSSFPRRDESVSVVFDVCGMARKKRSRNAEWDDHKEKCQLYVQANRGKTRAPAAPEPMAAQNLALLSELFQLDREEHEVLQFLVAMHASRQLKEFMEEFDEVSLTMAAELIAAATQASLPKVRRALSRSGRLMESGLLDTPPSHNCDLPTFIELKEGLLDVVLTPGLDRNQLFERYLTRKGSSPLGWGDYAHLGPEVEAARALLTAAVSSRRSGVNVLFVGPSGTGKTELAQLLATELGTALYAVGTSEEGGESADAKERLSSFLLAQRLLAKNDVLVLFDELEDLFSLTPLSARREARMSKQWFNLILERNPVPTIWISNDVGGVDKAFLRRFMYVIEFHPLTARQRTRVLARQLGPDSTVSSAEIEKIATKYEASPALFANAVAAARLVAPSGKPDVQNIERMLAPVVQLVEGKGKRQESLDASHYRLDLLNASEDLARIADALASWRRSDELGVSVCLYGPPGTGKSAFAHHLAQRIGVPIVHKRASDLLGPYVGQTEHAIAAAFREAERDGAMLLFDEADSFLRNRRHARQSWEVTQVNEVLTQLESYKGFVVCTTNLIDDLDEAAARRFTIKVELRHMLPEQSMLLFDELFGSGLARDFGEASQRVVRDALCKVTNLTPGDFAAIARRARSLGGSTVAELIDALLAASRAKPGQRRALGFAT
jgi:transitional endoplasmic reticulum ATPase